MALYIKSNIILIGYQYSIVKGKHEKNDDGLIKKQFWLIIRDTNFKQVVSLSIKGYTIYKHELPGSKKNNKWSNQKSLLGQMLFASLHVGLFLFYC